MIFVSVNLKEIAIGCDIDYKIFIEIKKKLNKQFKLLYSKFLKEAVRYFSNVLEQQSDNV